MSCLRIYGVVLLSVLLTPALSAQFAFATNSSSAANAPQIKEGPKFKVAQKVYQDLMQARGDFRMPVPTFIMNRGEEQVAFANPSEMIVGLEEKAYNVCRSFGADSLNALAMLMGHEATHYYEKHAWRQGFAWRNRDLAVGLSLDSLQDKMANETEADYLGGFLAYSAGYGVFDKGAEFIDKIYDAYGLKQKPPPDYPSLAERKALTQRSGERLKQLVSLFDAANIMVAIGQYKMAADFYERVLLDYQSQRLYNNAGVIKLLDGLDCFTAQELGHYRYPIELDLEFSPNSKGESSGYAEKKDRLLHEAIHLFDQAISLDPDYAPAYLNKAIAYLLLDDIPRALAYVSLEALPRAEAQKKAKVIEDCKILHGLIAVKSNNLPEAKKQFQELAAKNTLAKYNLSVAEGNIPEPELAPSSLFSLKIERIDGVNIATFSDGFDQKLTQTVGSGYKYNQLNKPGSKVIFIEDRVGTGSFLYQITNTDYKEATARGIKIGDDREKVKSQYKDPKREVQTTRGDIMVYDKIMFFMQNGKVEKWVNYLLPE
ncbi:MAG: hypothetical protein H6555_10700 [Lewinellaceae bacterium]|nr:hypothetical protein [Lewinellaceae bacterium]